MDPIYLRSVQRAGWQIRAVEADSVVVGCPRSGCGLNVRLSPNGHIPDTCGRGAELAEVVVGSYEDARCALRKRREELALTIREVEEISGAIEGHLLKAEKDDPSRIINVELFVWWAKSLGFDVVLRPADMPPASLRYLATTRGALKSRGRVRDQMRAKRKKKPA